MIEKVQGIIINVTQYQEASKILKIYTKEHGIISVIAKGVKSKKSNLRAYTNLHTYAYFYIYYKENKLSLLSQVDIINYFENIRKDIVLLSYMAYLCDLITQVYKQCQDNNLFDLLITTLIKINNNLDPMILTNILELHLLEYLGVNLTIDKCSKCGKKTNILTLSIDSGGLICQDCYSNEYIVNIKTISTIRKYYYVDINSITEIKVSQVVKKEINNFIREFYDKYTGIYLKSHDFLSQMLNLN